MILVEYDSTNSGGDWWLSDDDWINLEKAGWHVEWGGIVFCYDEDCDFNFSDRLQPPVCENPSKCKGHRKYESHTEVKNRFLNALSTGCSKEFNSMKEAIVEFEKITGQDTTKEGRNCCGPPHTFWDKTNNKYYSGEDILEILYDEKLKSKRQLYEERK